MSVWVTSQLTWQRKMLCNNSFLVYKAEWSPNDTTAAVFSAQTNRKMSSSSNNSQIIIGLNKILNLNDSSEIKRMETEFESNGWCFISLPTELIPNSTLIEQLSSFFESGWGRRLYRMNRGIYGYSKLDHKEGIKLLTRTYFEQFANKGLVPLQLVKPLNYLIQVLDAVAKRLIEVLDQHCVFHLYSSIVLTYHWKKNSLVCSILYLISTIKVVFNHHQMDNQLKKSIVFHIMIQDYFQLVYFQHMKDFNWKIWWVMNGFMGL